YRGYIMGLHRAPYPASIVEPPPMRGCETRDEVPDERFRSAARGGNPAAAPLCARPDPGCVTRRRSRPELPDPRGRQTASLAARPRPAPAADGHGGRDAGAAAARGQRRHRAAAPPSDAALRRVIAV